MIEGALLHQHLITNPQMNLHPPLRTTPSNRYNSGYAKKRSGSAKNQTAPRHLFIIGGMKIVLHHLWIKDPCRLTAVVHLRGVFRPHLSFRHHGADPLRQNVRCCRRLVGLRLLPQHRRKLAGR